MKKADENFRISALVVTGVTLSLAGCLDLREQEAPSKDECAVCHGGTLAQPFSAAPPLNLAGQSERAARGNGAHQIHLLGTDRSRPLACDECHHVPDELYAPGHVDSAYPAEVRFSGPAVAFEAQPTFEAGSCKDTFCHGGYFVGGRPSGGSLVTPNWLDLSGKPAECGSCHGLPPPSPHPDDSACADCHHNIRADGTFSNPDLHVDGLVTFYLPSGE